MTNKKIKAKGDGITDDTAAIQNGAEIKAGEFEQNKKINNKLVIKGIKHFLKTHPDSYIDKMNKKINKEELCESCGYPRSQWGPNCHVIGQKNEPKRETKKPVEEQTTGPWNVNMNTDEDMEAVKKIKSKKPVEDKKLHRLDLLVRNQLPWIMDSIEKLEKEIEDLRDIVNKLI